MIRSFAIQEQKQLSCIEISRENFRAYLKIYKNREGFQVKC